MKKSIKVIIIVIAIIILIVIIGGIIISGMVRNLENFIADVDIKPVELSQVDDGTFKGKTNAGIIQVVLEVDVKDHEIRDIRILKHRNGQGADAEKLIPAVIKEQRIDLDAITGATYSSLAIQNAIYDALTE